MKHFFTISICLFLLATNQLVKAQSCNAGIVSALRDTVCQGTSASLTDKGSNGNIQWQSTTTDTFANIKGATDSSLSISHVLQTTYFRAVVSNGSCSDTSLVFRVFVPTALEPSFIESQKDTTPIITFNSDSSKGNIIRYHWDFGDGDTSNENNPVHNYAHDSTYYACVTEYDSFRCNYTFCRYVETYPTGQFPCSASFSFTYSGNTVHFTSNIQTPFLDFYYWDFGDGVEGSGLNPVYTYDSSGTFNVCLYVQSYDCNPQVCHDVSVIVNAVKSVSANQQALIVYPNPCADCEIKGVQNINDLLVTDLLGRVIPVSFSKQSNGYGLNFPFAGNGMYLVKNVRTGEVVKVVRE